jgi:metallo-beta-lactamase family protein
MSPTEVALREVRWRYRQTMRVKFLGAAQTVTGSMHLLDTGRGKILIDCGLFQGRREESRRRNRELPSEATGADALILTHAHIDHSGSIPTLVKKGFRGSIYATPATRDLCAYMLRDAARIQEYDARWLNRKFADDPDFTPIEPLYTEEDAIEALGLFVTVAYGRRFDPVPGVEARFLDAGHILGSAEVSLRMADRHIVFTGDLGRKGLPILRDPQTPAPPVDYLFMESTYGNRVHGDVASMHADLERVVKATAERGGKVIVPAFAVGRTQEIVYSLNHLWREGRLPDIPVFIDSPLSVNVTEVFKLHPDCFDAETRAFLEEHGEVFSFRNVKLVSKVEESMRLNQLAGPAIIISSSGMCEAGRILHHLRNNVEDPRNTIMIVGYQAQHTLGRRIVERRKKVKILGVERDLRAQVAVLNAFSAHADRDDLLGYARATATDARHLFLVHGEPEQQEPLLKTLGGMGIRATAPAAGDEAELS